MSAVSEARVQTGSSGDPARPRNALTQRDTTRPRGGKGRASRQPSTTVADPAAAAETPARNGMSGLTDAGVSDFRGRAMLSLINDLAMGEWSPRELATMRSTTETAIEAFRVVHEQDIAERRLALIGELNIETAGLWVAKRQNRLAEIQQDVEDVQVVLDALRQSGVAASGDADFGFGLGTRKHVNLLKAKLALLRAAADELTPTGRLAIGKQGQNDEDKLTVRFVVDGDDVMEAL